MVIYHQPTHQSKAALCDKFLSHLKCLLNMHLIKNELGGFMVYQRDIVKSQIRNKGLKKLLFQTIILQDNVQTARDCARSRAGAKMKKQTNFKLT